MNRLLRLTTGLALLASPLAAAPHCTPLGPYGGFVSTLTVDPASPQGVHAPSRFQGPFKGTDGGATWHLSSRGLVQTSIEVIAVDPAQHTRVYLGGESLWRSLDGGASWQRARQGLPKGFAGRILALAVAP